MNDLIKILVNVISTPLLLLNSFGGIIAFIWLAFAAEWTLIGYGILGILFSAFALSIPFLLSGAIAIVGFKIYQKIKIFGYPFFLIFFLRRIYFSVKENHHCI